MQERVDKDFHHVNKNTRSVSVPAIFSKSGTDNFETVFVLKPEIIKREDSG